MKARIGLQSDRVDAARKLTGRAPYVGDISFEGMLHARTLRSSVPRARIRSVRLPELPRGYFVVDHGDIPGLNRVKIVTDDQPFLADGVVNYIGEPILLVVGPDRETLRRILAGAIVEYDELEPVLGIEAAESEGADWCFVEHTVRKGDPERTFARAAHLFEGEYRTGLQEHLYLEPQGVIGTFENGRITVYGSMQCPYYVKGALVQALGWSEDRIRVVQTNTGGAFGGKEDYPSLIAGHAAFAAIKSRRPVRLVLERQEDIRSTTKRHPSVFRLRSALDGRGRITGMEIDIRLDGGAYEGLSPVVLQRAMFTSTGVYRVDNARVHGRVFRTNTVPSGAFRGFGGPQATFAIEMHMQEIAERLGEDPVAFKLRHLLRKGDLTVTGGRLRETVKIRAMARKVLAMSGYRRKAARYRRCTNRFDPASGTPRRPGDGGTPDGPSVDARRGPASGSGGVRSGGMGFSLFLHGSAFTGSGEKDRIKAKVKLARRADGTIEILVSSAELGQGPSTTLRTIVARTLGIPLGSVAFENPDTDRVPDSGPTVASRTALIVGGLLERAARDLKKRWDTPGELAATAEYEQPGHVAWDQDTFRGDAYQVYSWGANVVDAEVDPLTFEVEVKGVWAVYDVGTPLDERIVRGQIEGGIAQGLGYAAMEVMRAREGAILQGSLAEYAVPTSLDVPRIKSGLVTNPYEHGPFGAKGAGELTFVGAAPALASAVQNALGIPIRSIPLRPEDIMEVAAHAR